MKRSLNSDNPYGLAANYKPQPQTYPAAPGASPSTYGLPLPAGQPPAFNQPPPPPGVGQGSMSMSAPSTPAMANAPDPWRNYGCALLFLFPVLNTFSLAILSFSPFLNVFRWKPDATTCFSSCRLSAVSTRSLLSFYIYWALPDSVIQSATESISFFNAFSCSIWTERACILDGYAPTSSASAFYGTSASFSFWPLLFSSTSTWLWRSTDARICRSFSTASASARVSARSRNASSKEG